MHNNEILVVDQKSDFTFFMLCDACCMGNYIVMFEFIVGIGSKKRFHKPMQNLISIPYLSEVRFSRTVTKSVFQAAVMPPNTMTESHL